MGVKNRQVRGIRLEACTESLCGESSFIHHIGCDLSALAFWTRKCAVHDDVPETVGHGLYFSAIQERLVAQELRQRYSSLECGHVGDRIVRPAGF